MRRALAALIVLVLTAVLGASSLAAQQVPTQPTNPNGPVQQALPCYEDCGGGGPDEIAPTIYLTGDPLTVTVPTPTLTMNWCDNASLASSTRWVTVNGVDRTSAFSDWQSGVGICDEIVRARSVSTPITLTAGNNTVVAGTCDNADNCTTQTFTVFYNNQPAPMLSLAPYSPDLLDYGRCAMACFAATYAQSTVPYFSLDTPRNVTLVYNGDRVDPKPFIHVDVTHSDAGNVPQYFQLRLRKADQTYVTFLNGESTVRFTAGVGTWRIGGQFDPATNNMSADVVHAVTVVVGAVYSGGVVETAVATRVIVLNENDSPIAKGWTLAGVQRLYPQAGGSALIAEGEGSATYFQKVASLFVSPTGDFSRLTVAGTGSGTVYTRAYPDSTKVRFNYLGLMTSVRDRFGNLDSIQYQGNAVWRIIDPNGTYQQLTYNANGLSSIAALGRTTTVTVQANRTLTAITDPDNFATQFGYDGNLRLRTVTDRNGATRSSLAYHANSGKVVADSGPSVPVIGDSTARPVTRFAPWQHFGVPYVATLSPASPAALVRSDTVRATVTDPASHATRFTTNAFGQPLVTTDALGNVTTVAYASGLPIRVTSPTGATDSATYNSDGLPTSTWPAGRAATTTWYTAGRWGQPDSTRTTGQATVHFAIGVNGRIDRQRILWDTTFYAYDSRGRVTAVTDPGHHTTSTAYAGVNGNRSSVTAPGYRTTQYNQDGFGRDTSARAPEAPRNRVVYDLLNRVTEQYDSAGATPTRSWWGRIYLDSLQDPGTNRHRFAYNALGWVTRRTDPNSAVDSTKYDLDGLPRTWTNRRNQTITMAYDALHRRTSKSGTGTQTESWSYSADGRVVTATSPTSIETVRINSAGLTDSVITVMVGQTFRQHYRYDDLGRPDSIWAAGGGVTFQLRQYYYLSTGELYLLALGNATTELVPNAEGLCPELHLPGGATVAPVCNGIHRPAMVNAAPGSTSSFANAVVTGAAYDSVGRIAREIRNVEGTGRGYDWEATGYRYDRLGRLRAESIMVNNAPPASCDGGAIVDEYGNTCLSGYGWVATSGTTYSYDAVGNRTDRSGTYTTGNRLTNFDGCSYTTDADGNVTKRKCGADSTLFYWSAESRLDSLRVGAMRIGYRYDALGRLVRRDSAGVAQRHYLWDGDNLLAELNGTATGMMAEYSYYGMDRLHAVVVGTTPYYGHQDVRGSSLALTRDSSLAYQRYWYDAWGTPEPAGEPFGGADRARWKGALSFESDAGLYYMRNRWYEPRTGRFISEDPIGLQGGINPYIFTLSEPVNRYDPMGLDMRIYVGGEAWDCFDLGPRTMCYPLMMHDLVLAYRPDGEGIDPASPYGSWRSSRGSDAVHRLPTWANVATGTADALSLGLGPAARWGLQKVGCESCIHPDASSGDYWAGFVLGAVPYAVLGGVYLAQGAPAFAPGGYLNTGFGGWFRIGWSRHGGEIFRATFGPGRDAWIKINFWWK